MLSNLRRLIQNPIGAAIALGFVALLGLAFVLSDRSGTSGNGARKIDDADIVATVGNKTITTAQLRGAVQRDIETIRQQQPGLDIAQYLAAGGLEITLDRLIASTATRQYGEKVGMVVSKRQVDGAIASIPSLQTIDGKFNQSAYDTVLKQQGITDADARLQFVDQILFRNLMLPTTDTKQVPALLAMPYANLLLETRTGQIALIPSQALGLGAAPSEAELSAFYARNLGQYRVPERRVFRYALLSAATLAAQGAPTDAEIASAFTADAAKYAAVDLRTIAQVIVGYQQAAAALAAKVRGGTALAEAARAAGLEPATLSDLKQADYAAQTSPDIARDAFAAKQGDVIGPARAPLGYVVARVESTRRQAAKTLAEATPEIRTALATQKVSKLLVAKRNGIDDALSSNTKFDAVLAQQHLTAQQSPALVANGIDPQNPTAKPDPIIAAITAAAFASDPADGPQSVPTGQDGSFAVVSVDRILPAAPRPLAQIRDAATRDFQIDRAKRGARAAAAKVIVAVNGGTPLAAAMATTGLKLPPIQPISGPRSVLIKNPREVPAPLVLLFSMATKTAKLTEAPNNGGYFVIYLDSVVRGDARGRPDVIAGTRSDIGKVIGREYGEQLNKAIQQAVGTRKNDKAIAAVKAELSGVGAPAQP